MKLTSVDLSDDKMTKCRFNLSTLGVNAEAIVLVLNDYGDVSVRIAAAQERLAEALRQSAELLDKPIG